MNVAGIDRGAMKRVLVVAVAVLLGCTKGSPKGNAASQATTSSVAADVKITFPVKSPDFAAGGALPTRLTCDGDATSPGLSWTGSFGETKSFAVIVDDPDAPSGDFTHWVLFDVPSSTTSLEPGSKNVGVEGKNDFDHDGYGAPCPPKGKGAHRYYFRVYALDLPTLGLKTGASRADVENAMKGHVLAYGELMGTFEH